MSKSWVGPIEDDADITTEKVVGFAQGAFYVLAMLGIDTAGKMYDPLSIEEEKKIAHSYVLNLADGGRHHEYESLMELFEMIQLEVAFNFTRVAYGFDGYVSVGEMGERLAKWPQFDGRGKYKLPTVEEMDIIEGCFQEWFKTAGKVKP